MSILLSPPSLVNPKIIQIQSKIKPGEKIRYDAVKTRRSYDAPVRPTISSDDMSALMKNSSKYVRMRDISFPISPRNSHSITIKTQEWELVTNLDCFLKHISTKTYQRYVAEKAPRFKKSIVKEVKFPDVQGKSMKKTKELSLISDNLELLGQKEVSGGSPKIIKDNLLKVNRKINRDVKKWCITEMKRSDPETQLIDYQTFKFKV